MTLDQSPHASIFESVENGIDVAQQGQVEAAFPIVGIAASAGGVEAFTQLLSHLPIDTGMGFVLIQHLAPDHKSLLTEIMARTTQMPVNEVEDGMAIAPNQVYVIPPNTKMTLVNGLLQLNPREKAYGKYMPGDAFFGSLAVDRGHKAIAVVLSGADGDGAQGLKAIKMVGGVTFAQCEDTAQFDSMPNTAVATGNVDFVLPPQKIAEELANLSRNPFRSRVLPLTTAEKSPEVEDALATIFRLLRSATGVDFSYYKPNTLDRRIQRRMLLYKLERLEDYAQYLQGHPEEVKVLYEEILIHVTNFFRDPEAFQQLKEQVFPTITKNKSLEFPIRIWVAGCSTGEEVYSIAICLLEFLESKATRPPIQIFATDISESAIEKARSGIYQESQMVEVSPERRKRFFNALERGSYQIGKMVRELCVFARQDLGSDPPFPNIDLVSCRNVLIYLGENLQKRIMPLFHYSLNPNGFLLLGTAEGAGRYSDLFTSIDKKYKLYAKTPSTTRPTLSFMPSNHRSSKPIDRALIAQSATDGSNLQQEIDRVITNHYAPVGVVINDKMDVLQLRGNVDRYLKLVSGTPNLNLFNMAREGLLGELRAAIYQAQRQEVPVRKNGLYVAESDRTRMVNLQVIPFQAPTTKERRFLVLFEEPSPIISASVDSEIPAGSAQGDLEQEITRLQKALVAAIQEQGETQEYLQIVIQEQEHVNQDLKVANEEILSSNEELQSTNEELETAKEEIQSTNEELNTTNEELRSLNSELYQVNNDLTNLLASINIPILMLSNDLHIRRFTPMAQRLFNFIPTDAGRPLSDIRANLNTPNLEPLILEVLETLTVKELEVQTPGGHCYMLRIRPYRTIKNQIDGVVLVLVDINDLKRSAVTLEAARNYAEAIVETVRVPLIVLEPNFRVNKANRAFYETFQVSSAETVQRLLFELGNGQWNLPDLRSLLDSAFEHDTVIENFEVKHQFEQIGQRTMLLSAWRIIENGNAQKILLAIEDITERQQLETERSHLLTQEQVARQEAETANRTKDVFLSNLSHELRNPLNVMLGWLNLLRTRNFDTAATTKAIETVERSAKAQSQLIDDMLDVSRIVSGKLQLKTGLIDLAPVVMVAIESIQPAAEAKAVQIVSDLATVFVMGDIDRLQQVLWNILSNAIKFTPAGGQVEVTLESVNQQCQIRVRDTGQGIQADLLPYIFDRFRQGDSSTTKASQGLGLGLAIVRQLIELHGGTIEAESAGEGQGTTMTVKLPLRSLPSADTSSIEPTNTGALSVAAVPTLTDLRILVVDDEADNCALMEYTLEEFGAEVLAVASAKEAIAAFIENPGQYDVLLADIGMPEENGYSLIRKIRALAPEAGGQVLAIAITAYASSQDHQVAIDAGFQAHVAKPVELDPLVLLIATLVQES